MRKVKATIAHLLEELCLTVYRHSKISICVVTHDKLSFGTDSWQPNTVHLEFIMMPAVFL